MIKFFGFECDAVGDAERLLKSFLKPEQRTIACEAVEIRSNLLTAGPMPGEAAPAKAGAVVADDRRAVNVKVVVKTNVHAKKSVHGGLQKGESEPQMQGSGKMNSHRPFDETRCKSFDETQGKSTVHGEVGSGIASVSTTKGARDTTKMAELARGPTGNENHERLTANRKDGRATVGKDGDIKLDGVLRPLCDWAEVELKGERISLRKREKAKEFLRLLWSNGANRRSKAIVVGSRYSRPASLFSAGTRFVRDHNGPTGRHVPVKSERGELISRVYWEGVGTLPPDTKGKGPTKFYLKVFKDSDVT